MNYSHVPHHFAVSVNKSNVGVDGDVLKNQAVMLNAGGCSAPRGQGVFVHLSWVFTKQRGGAGKLVAEENKLQYFLRYTEMSSNSIATTAIRQIYSMARKQRWWWHQHILQVSINLSPRCLLSYNISVIRPPV